MSAKKHYDEFASRRRASVGSARKSSSARRESSSDIDKVRQKPEGVPNKPWRQLTATRVSERRKMPRHCFLDQENRKYPVCYRNSTQTSCVGLQAAKKRASLQKRTDIVKLAEQREKHFGCNSEKSHWRQREASIYRESTRRRSVGKKRS